MDRKRIPVPGVFRTRSAELVAAPRETSLPGQTAKVNSGAKRRIHQPKQGGPRPTKTNPLCGALPCMAVACLKMERCTDCDVVPGSIEPFARSQPSNLCCNAVLRTPELTHGFEAGATRETTMTQTAQQSREKEIKELIQRRFRQMAPLLRGHKVYLFGSRASGLARPRSDFDIGVLGDEPLPLRTFTRSKKRSMSFRHYSGLTGLT